MKELVEVMAKSLVSKQGRIAKAIRTVMKAVATRENVKVIVEIV